MKRTLPLACLAAALALPALAAQDPETQRRQIPELGFQERIDVVFGDIIAWISYLPFMNIADYIGLSTDPQLLRDEQGTPAIERRPLDSSGAITQTTLSADGNRVLGFGGQTAQLWDLTDPTGATVTFAGHTAAITAAAFFPDLGEVAIGDAGGNLRIWNPVPEADSDQAILVGEYSSGQTGAILALAYSSDGAWLATGSADGTVVLWDPNMTASPPMPDHQGGAVSITFSPDNEHLATRDAGGTVRIRRTDGVTVATLTGQRTAQQFSADGQHLVTEDPSGDVHLVSIDGTGEVAISTGAGGRLIRWSVAGAGDEIAVATLDSSGTTKSFGADGAETGSSAHPALTAALLAGLNGEGGSSSFAGDGTRLIASGGGGTEVWEWFVRGPDGNVVSNNVPAVVLWLVVAAVFFTLFMKFVNLRMFKHAIAVVRGKYSNPDDEGEVTHFQALSSALSATVGLGNIAGVAIAVSIGGPGATFWMIVAGFLGMTLKFTECTLGQKFRKIDDNGRVSGGPMHYLKEGLAQKGLAALGIPLTIIFTVFCIGGSLAGGNSFQVNQSLTILSQQIPFFQDNGWVYGLVMSFFVGIVIIGGIRRIAQTAEKIVPTMCSIYVLAAMIIIIANISAVPGAFGAIFSSALTGDAVYGGAIGALITGFRRAAFSNEAGIGSAAIAHSAARTPFAVREGIVALLEPFIDTVVVCTMTALVIIITGVYDAERFPEFAGFVVGNEGAALTGAAFAQVSFLSWFPWLLMIAVILFAYSTMISWSYYGERCWTNLFGPGSSIYYKILFLVFVVLGSVITATNILEFGDLMILLMAFPNILGLYFLGGLVKRDLKTYETKLNAGDMPVYK